MLPATHTAALAAYLGAAHQAAAHHRLLMTSPLPPALPTFPRGSISPLVTSSSSPVAVSPPPALSSDGNINSGAAALDFSTKRLSSSTPTKDDAGSDSVLNLSKPSTPTPSESNNGPLDLSVSSRKRTHDETIHPARKSSRLSTDFKPVVSPWTSPVVASHFPYFAAAVAAASSLSPKNAVAPTTADPTLWNGKMKSSGHFGGSGSVTGMPTPSDATKALEKMSELSKLGGGGVVEDAYRGPAGAATRHSAWQSHWLNKGAEQAKDVLKCVWCKQSFPSLAAMTAHMKEAKHCGVNVPTAPPIQPPPPPPPPQHTPPTSTSSGLGGGPNGGGGGGGSGKPSSADLNLLIKETMPLPRKLVRGQDVWLGKGAEQTRQILKCMWCGQSFRSLAEMTSHMQQTQHYTNIISQEQIISWKSSDEGKHPSGGNTGAGGGGGGPGAGSGTSSHVSAVLTCKVCDQAFSSLKELSNHMVKNSHYKEHIMRSITESGGRRRQTREKRKKSLPVRKLLELERAQHELKNGGGIEGPLLAGAKAGRITCEKCGDKIDTALFVEHIRQCVGGSGSNLSSGPTSHRNLLKNALLSSEAGPTENRKSSDERSPSADITSPGSGSGGGNGGGGGDTNSPSVLNAIEKLIEKSFDSRQRHAAAAFGGVAPTTPPIGSSILKRLGIDESVDYTKPLVDAQTMNLLRSYQQHARRERSGSESSSVSDRGGGRLGSLTPDRKPEPSPDKRTQTPPKEEDSELIKGDLDNVKIKIEDDRATPERISPKQEPTTPRQDNCEEEGEIDGRRSSAAASPALSPRQLSSTPGAPAASPCRLSSSSPASSDRSATPAAGDKKSSSLGALSSMFDSLSSGAAAASGGAAGSESGRAGGATSSHPLAALQKLCDKTDRHPGSNRASSAAVNNHATGSGSTGSSSTTPGAILAFSWACNDAVVTADSIMKCAFCDTPFISKGAYRHHLSKMHFVKDGVMPDPVPIKGSNSGNNAGGAAGGSRGSSPSGSVGGGGGNNSNNSTKNGSAPGTSNNHSSSSNQAKSPPHASTTSSTSSASAVSNATGTFEESPHSKFLKYTELAKQLSSKYV